MARSRFQAATVPLLTVVALFLSTTARAAGPDRDLGDYVVFGLAGARLGNEAFLANGDFGANNAGALAQLGKHAFMANGTEMVGDQAKVLTRTSLCDLFTNGLLSSLSQITIRCAGPTTFSPLPVIPAIPALPVFAPGTSPVGAGMLAPGAYGQVNLRKGQTLELTGGTYEFAGFNVSRQAKVLIDGPTTLDVQGGFRLGDQSVFGPVNASFPVTVNVGGTLVRFGRNAMAVMDLFAPNALIRFGKSFFGKGHFVGLMVGSDKNTMFDGGGTTTTTMTSSTSTTGIGTTSTTAFSTTSTTGASTTTTTSGASTTTTTTGASTTTTTGASTTTTTGASTTTTTGASTTTTTTGASTTTTTGASTTTTTGASTTTTTTGASTTTTTTEGSTTTTSGASTTTTSTASSSTTSTTEPGNFCTFTQGAAGAPNGFANGPTGVITENPSVLPVTVGAPGDLSLTVQDQASLICFLPAGGTPAALCTGLSGCGGDMLINACSNPPILDFNPSGNGSSGGQGGGTLTGQTIVAKLAVALSALGATPPGLGNFVLPTELCTTAGIFMISPNIANGVLTVSDLLLMADQALRDPTAFTKGTITRSDIDNALNAINTGFDECQSVVSCP